MIRTRTKIEAVLAVAFLLAISISSVFAVTRTISDTGDTVYTQIICSNGNTYEATFANLVIACAIPNIEIVLPSHNFTITNTFPIASGVTLTGMGNSTLLYFATGTNKNMITIDANDVRIEGIQINFNGAGQTSTSNLTAIYLGTCNQITIDHCSFYNAHGSFIVDSYNKVSKNVTIADCDFHERVHRYWGGAIHTWNQGWTIKNNFIEDTYACGIVIEGSIYNPVTASAGMTIIDGNRITGDIGTGIYTEGFDSGKQKSTKCVIVNNIIWHLTGIAYGANTAVGIMARDNVTCSNNIIYDVAKTGIQMNGNNTVVSNNVINKILVSGYGILTSGNALNQSGIITGNTITNITGQGIYGGATWRKLIISNNMITGCSSNSIRSSALTNVITGNIVTGGTYGIFVDASSFNTISNNIIKSVTTRCMELNLIANSSICGNTINSAGIYGGLVLEDSRYNTVVGNIVCATKGIIEINTISTCNWNVIVANNCRASTTNITIVGANTIKGFNL